jgi:hypothetical protein
MIPIIVHMTLLIVLRNYLVELSIIVWRVSMNPSPGDLYAPSLLGRRNSEILDFRSQRSRIIGRPVDLGFMSASITFHPAAVLQP